MQFPSKLIEDAVSSFSGLPGIGKKTALRLVMHLLDKSKDEVHMFSSAISKMRDEIKFCLECHNISDNDVCSICLNRSRNHQTICVVETIKDLIAIENTQQYHGVYHILGGVISPIDGIGPENLNIDSLISRVEKNDASELIMALNPTMEGDTTVFYLSKRFTERDITISTIARGVSFGSELEYTDELTLARSLVTRIPYQKYIG